MAVKICFQFEKCLFNFKKNKSNMGFFFNLQMNTIQGYSLLLLNWENMQICSSIIDLKLFLLMLTPKPNSNDTRLNNEFKWARYLCFLIYTWAETMTIRNSEATGFYLIWWKVNYKVNQDHTWFNFDLSGKPKMFRNILSLILWYEIYSIL